MFDKPNSRLFKQEYVEKAEYYFEKFGPAKAVVLARFIPIVRTFLNPVAGVLGMPASSSCCGTSSARSSGPTASSWSGYLLADRIYAPIGTHIDRYILPFVALIILISVMPILIEIIRDRRAKKNAAAVAIVAASAAAGVAEAVDDKIKHVGNHRAED